MDEEGSMTHVIIAGLLLASIAAVAEPVTIKGETFNIQYGEPDLRGIAVDHITVGNRHFDACERQTKADWVQVDCKTGREMGSSR